MKHTHKHFIVNKPYGMLSQFVSNQTTRKNKKKLGSLYKFPAGSMAIGRLDEKSEGLLLLTTDGKLSEYIRSSRIEKEYYVQLDGIMDLATIKKLEQGVHISVAGEKYKTKPAKVRLLDDVPRFPERAKPVRDDRHGPTSWISITIVEGKFRQIRKMTAVVGFPTLRLVRVRIGNIKLENLKSGAVMQVDSLL